MSDLREYIERMEAANTRLVKELALCREACKLAEKTATLTRVTEELSKCQDQLAAVTTQRAADNAASLKDHHEQAGRISVLTQKLAAVSAVAEDARKFRRLRAAFPNDVDALLRDIEEGGLGR